MINPPGRQRKVSGIKAGKRLAVSVDLHAPMGTVKSSQLSAGQSQHVLTPRGVTSEHLCAFDLVLMNATV